MRSRRGYQPSILQLPTIRNNYLEDSQTFEVEVTLMSFNGESWKGVL
jgi:hypothetical protein